MYYDSTYILVLIGVVISAIASINVNSTFKKFDKVASASHITAEQAALAILRSAGINDVRIEHIGGNLTDHYDPSAKVLRLSDSVLGSSSIAAIGVAAHECGHAIQHKENYGPLKLRSVAIPMANIGSKLSIPVIVIGIALGLVGLARIGVFLFSFVLLFQLITLPVEFNASSRAIAILDQQEMLVGSEVAGARKVLNAAALTYVAAVLSSVLQLLRLVLMTRRGNRRS